jgi:hypothetical protein
MLNCYVLLESQVSMSTSVTYIPSDPSECRRKTVVGTKFLATAMDLYCLRPMACKDLAYKPFFRQHVILPRSKNAPAGFSLVGTTEDGACRVYRPSRRHIVRFSDPNPAYKPEAYFFDLLLEHVSFTDEGHLLSARNRSGTYFEECRLRGIVSSVDDLQQHIEM